MRRNMALMSLVGQNEPLSVAAGGDRCSVAMGGRPRNSHGGLCDHTAFGAVDETPAAAGMYEPRPHRRDRERASARDAVRDHQTGAVWAGQTFGNVGAYEKVVGRFAATRSEKPAQCGNRRPRQGAAQRPRDGRVFGRLLHPQAGRCDQGQRRAVLRARQSRQQGHSPPFQLRRRQRRPHDRAARRRRLLPDVARRLCWNGWIDGTAAANNTLRIELPVATNPSGPIVETVWDQVAVQRDRGQTGAPDLQGDLDRPGAG